MFGKNCRPIRCFGGLFVGAIDVLKDFWTTESPFLLSYIYYIELLITKIFILLPLAVTHRIMVFIILKSEPEEN